MRRKPGVPAQRRNSASVRMLAGVFYMRLEAFGLKYAGEDGRTGRQSCVDSAENEVFGRMNL